MLRKGILLRKIKFICLELQVRMAYMLKSDLAALMQALKTS